MEFLYTQSRSSGSSLSQYSFDNVMKQKVGLSYINLLILDDKPSDKPRIVFQTKDLTKTFVENKTPPLKFDSSKGKSIVEVDRQSSSAIKQCMLSRYGLNVNPNHFNIATKSFPVTTCKKHGNIGFLPLDYVRILPEYTCTIHKYPVFKVVHIFEDCILEFPSDQNNAFAKSCFHCYKKISKEEDIYMYKDDPFCSPDCRNDASIAHRLYKKMMKGIEETDEDISASSTDEETIFTIAIS